MLKSEKYEYGSMWTFTGFVNRVIHMSDNLWLRYLVLYPLAVFAGMFVLMFTLCGGFLLTVGTNKRRKEEAKIWRHREELEAMKRQPKS